MVLMISEHHPYLYMIYIFLLHISQKIIDESQCHSVSRSFKSIGSCCQVGYIFIEIIMFPDFFSKP